MPHSGRGYRPRVDSWVSLGLWKSFLGRIPCTSQRRDGDITGQLRSRGHRGCISTGQNVERGQLKQDWARPASRSMQGEWGNRCPGHVLSSHTATE